MIGGELFMYLNRAQKYVLELLREYGALKKSQLEVMARHKVAEYLTNLNGYLKQMSQGREIDVLPCGDKDAYIALPGTEPDADLIAAFDVVIAMRSRIETHSKGKGRVKINFTFETEKNRINQAFVLAVHPGEEPVAVAYADNNLQGDFQTVFFLCFRKGQMQLINSQCEHIFAVHNKGETLFFRGP